MEIMNEAFWQEYLRMIQDGTTAPLTVTGNSMSPFLVHLRDTVYLSPITKDPAVGDIILYRRDNGAYILHRIRKQKNGSYTMVGDAQTWLEKDLRRDQLLAVVTGAVRKGKHQVPGTFWWEFFRVFWIRIVPLRPVFLKFYRICVFWKRNK